MMSSIFRALDPGRDDDGQLKNRRRRIFSYSHYVNYQLGEIPDDVPNIV